MARDVRGAWEVAMMDLEQMLNDWMEQHPDELFHLLAEEAERFRAAHPGMDYEEERLNAQVMASRRYLARAIGQVLPRYLAALGLPVAESR